MAPPSTSTSTSSLPAAPALPSPGGRARLIATALALAVTVALCWWALKGVHPSQIWHALKSSDGWWIVPSLVAFVLANGARALRWRSLFAPGRRPGVLATTNAMLIGYLFNNVLPARAGEAARVVTLTRRAEVPAAEVVATVVVERIFDVFALLVIFFAAQPWLPHVSWIHAAALAAIGLAVAIAAVVVVLTVWGERALRIVLAPAERLPFVSPERTERAAGELLLGLAGLRRHGVALTALALTAVAWMLSALCCWLAAKAFPLHLGLDAGVLVTSAVGLSMVLPAPPAALGVFEAAVVLALHAYGLTHGQALPYALVLHAINFFPFILVGLGVLAYNARHPPGRKLAS
ncbi:MAG TPA: lysylphosphatidylglycerol synthase transmembrane domain-containing protein [Solirubrobacteraceae bacterium]|jgi:hypothetical protein|nr:lysylphosphatidylglycerol synthase transmembrane domain-containing protein [Solirubrobacteraceae bacterium]